MKRPCPNKGCRAMNIYIYASTTVIHIPIYDGTDFALGCCTLSTRNNSRVLLKTVVNKRVSGVRVKKKCSVCWK